MKTKLALKIAAAVLWFATLGLPISTALAQGTAFTYQGRLNTGTNPASGTYNLQFLLYTNSTGGSSVAGPVTTDGVVITNGLFTVPVDFGSTVWNGGTNWLQIGAETNGAATFTTVLPRQQVTPTPYAIFAEGANAAGLTGTIPTGDLFGTYSDPVTFNNVGNSFSGNGSGLTGLNASQLTSGTVPDAALPANVALLNAPSQTFTGTNTFAGAGESFIVYGSSISTSLFSGLGLQYDWPTGEGAIMSSYNNGQGYLTFYTKQASGYPIARQVMIDRFGGVAIDQQGANTGVINNGNTNGVGLTFGISSGEGIASQRQPGANNRYGLDFYTDFARRMSISQAGLVGIGVGTNAPDAALEVANGDMRIDGNALLLSATTTGDFANDGLYYDMAGLPGINDDTGPFLAGYYGGALGGLGPTVVSLSWDASGDVWVSNNLTTAALTVTGEYMEVNGLTPVYCYVGDDGSGDDVQIGSLLSGVKNVSCYNEADGAYMHLYCSGITIVNGSDLAEPFKISSGAGEVPQGAVVVIDEQNPGHLKVSDQAYDTRVAGVVSGANGINPGIQMQQQGLLEGGKNVALTGRVYVQADASNGAIKPGDLLTTSTTPGHAMKATDHSRAAGAILGKAMTGLSEGQGMVLVLVTLQ